MTVTDRRFASRKFILAAAAFLAGVAFYALGKMTAGEWVGFTQWLAAIYAAANVSDQAVTKVST